uniref:THIF-type NAD/FAD binding fold domain-containing protein n=1 Tax=Ditylenchus dipsaci TaxID=166011 RepID=A0A915DQY2_9BILA
MSQLQQESVRYDRQIRLWEKRGKNLVLAGFGSFHIVDDAVIGQTDLGQNFFMTESDIGKPRAEVVVKNLLELNPSVRGSCSLVSFVNFDLQDLLNYSLVVSTNLTEKKAEQLGDFLFEKNIYYIYARVCGMFGYLRLCYKQHAVWDSHTENPSHDFRLTKEFAELSQFAASMDLDAMNHEKHSHTPYLVLYVKALEKWKAIAGEEANGCSLTFCRNDLSEGVQKVLADPKSGGTCIELLQRLPDMTSDTARYTELGQIYRRKATDEAAELFEISKKIYQERRNLIMQISARNFPASTNVMMPRNFLGSRHDQSDEVYLETESANPNYSLSWRQCQHAESALGLESVLVRIDESYGSFRDGEGQVSGTNGVPCTIDSTDLKRRVDCLIAETKNENLIKRSSQLIPQEAINEICRFGAAEPHVICTMVGGAASQELSS